MFQGIFKSAINDANKNYIFGTGSIPIQIKSAQLATFADGTTKQQGYQVAEVNKLISTMLTGWNANGNKPKSMSDNYLELILSCDNGFVVKKRLQFPHIIAWQNDSTQYQIADVYKEFNIDNWLKADDFENPDITLVVDPTDEIITTSTATPPEVTTEQSGRFYLYYRNLPVGVNRVHIEFHIKTQTEPIDFDLEILDGISMEDAQRILASNEQAKINVLLSGVKDLYKFTGAEGNFENITMHEWSELYQQIISLKPNNKFTHDLYFYIYDESEINTKLTYLEKEIIGSKIGDLDTTLSFNYDNKSIDCDFFIGKKYKVVISTDKVCNVTIRYNTSESSGPAIIEYFNNNIGDAEFIWECNTDKAKDKLYFVPQQNGSDTYPVRLTAVLYEYDEDALESKVESVRERTTNLENALIDLREVVSKVDYIKRETNYFLEYSGSILQNQYTSKYAVTVYHLEEGKIYRLVIKNYQLISSDGGMFGFRNVPTIEIADNIVRDTVRYNTEPITEKIIYGEGQYLFTGELKSSPNFELYELSEIKKRITELIEEELTPFTEIKEVLDPMRALKKTNGESTTNYYINYSGIQTNKYTSSYKVTQYELKANTRYLIKIVNPNLLSSGVGMYGFSDKSGVENKSLQGIVKYGSTEETEVFVKFDTIKYLFTCDRASLTDNNFEVFEVGALRPIDDYVKDKVVEMKGEFKEELDNLADLVVPTIKIQIPDVVYASVGTELNFYNDCITLSIDRGLVSPLNYHTQWSCNFGRVHSRGIVFNPTVSDIGDHSCTCDIYTLSGKLIDSKVFTIKVVNSSMSAVKNILFVGDSLGTETYNQIVANFNNTDKYSGSIKPNLYNLSKGGWHWKTYAQEGIIYQRVEVSGVSSLAVGAKYVDSANNLFEIFQVNITEGRGNVLISKSYNPPYGYNDLTIPDGTLTKNGTSYGGDLSFSYTNGVNEAGNPFWNSSKGALDIEKFRSNKGISDKIDMVIFQLGINSSYNINTEGLVEGWITNIYNAFLADNPNTIFVFGCTPTATNDYSAIGSNYGVDSKSWGIGYTTNEYKFKDLYLRWGQDAEGHPNMRVIGEHLNIDRWYGYPISTRSVNAYSTATEEYHTNYMHPSTSGYKQIADAIFASIIGLWAL